MIESGTWPSVARDADARLVEEVIIVRVHDAEVWRQPVGVVTFLSAAQHPLTGEVRVAFRKQVGHADCAHLATAAHVVNLGIIAYGERSAVLRWIDSGWVLTVCINAFDWAQYLIFGDLHRDWIGGGRNPFAGTSAGITNVKEDLSIEWAESTVVDPLLKFTQTVNGVPFGQRVSDDSIGAYHDETHSVVLPGPCYEFQATEMSDGRFRVCARVPSGSAFATVPPWPVAIPAPVPVPEPPAPPVDLPGPPIPVPPITSPPVSHRINPFLFKEFLHA